MKKVQAKFSDLGGIYVTVSFRKVWMESLSPGISI